MEDMTLEHLLVSLIFEAVPPDLGLTQPILWDRLYSDWARVNAWLYQREGPGDSWDFVCP